MQIVLSLGSNMGNRAALLRRAVRLINMLPGTRIVGLSHVFETMPWGNTDQGAFYNVTAEIETVLSPHAVLARTQRIELKLGRERHEHWGPRPIDIDLIAAGELHSATELLLLPHPYAHQRAFVLAPWLQLDPEAQLVGHGSVRDLLARLHGPENHVVDQGPLAVVERTMPYGR